MTQQLNPSSIYCFCCCSLRKNKNKIYLMTMMMMMMCLKYRAQKYFWPWKIIFFENLSKGRRKDKIADELHKGTKKKFAARKKNFASIKCWRMRAETLFCMISANEFFFLSFLPSQWLEILSCVPHGWRGRKKGMKRYRRQIIISDWQCYMGEWMINKSKYHVEKRFSVRSFPRRFIETSRIDSIEYLWDLLKYDEISHDKLINLFCWMGDN